MIASLAAAVAGLTATPTTVPDRQGLADLCAAIELQSTEMRPLFPGHQFQFETYLARWAGVTAGEPTPVVDGKIAAFIDANMPRLFCNQFNFNPRNGSILKLAVAKQASRFLSRVTTRWRINLNGIDAADGKTVLDYTRDRRGQAGSDTPFGRTMARYHDMLRAAGARYSSELQ